MGGLLGIDLGSVRVGVAVCSPGTSIATPLATVAFKSRAFVVQELLKFIKDYQIEGIIVGLPKTMAGEIGPAAKKVLEHIDWFKSQIPVWWAVWDERLSSKESERILLEADLSRERRKQVIDQLAAQRILQSYIDAKGNRLNL